MFVQQEEGVSWLIRLFILEDDSEREPSCVAICYICCTGRLASLRCVLCADMGVAVSIFMVSLQ